MGRRRHRIAKAAGRTLPGGLQLPAGGVATDATGMTSALQAMTGQQYVDNGGTPLPRDPAAFYALFGPGGPMFPSPLNPVRPDTGQPDPRRYQFPVSWNLLDNQQKHVSWETLRQAADAVDVIRRCLEIRKAEFVALDWDITLSRRAVERAGAKTAGEKQSMREKFTDDIARLTSWWQTPDKTNGLGFADWLSMLLEEYMVLDALSIYPRMTYGGDLASLEVLDGSTIKPLLDARGNRPAPPSPAWQQWLYGFARGEYTHAGTADVELSAGQLLYRPRVVRAHTPYGFSPVEQALMSADIYLRRQGWMRSEYTEGTLPVSFLKTDLAANMTPEQLRAWEVSLNDFYGGSQGNRHRFRLLPSGFDPVPTADASERYKPEYDEFLVRLLAMHFDVDPMEIGFPPKGGLGGKGFSEGQTDAKYRKAIKPLSEWLTDLFNDISRRFLGMPEELTFQFLGGEADDEESADQVAHNRVEDGRMTVNEDRDRQGMPRYEGEWADKPFVSTAGGPVWLDKAYEEATAPLVPAVVPQIPGQAAPASGESAGGGSGGGAGRSSGQGLPSVAPRSVQPQVAGQFAQDNAGRSGGPRDGDGDGILNEKADELGVFVRYVRKRAGRTARPFAFSAVEDQLAAELNGLAATDPAAAIEQAQLVKASAGDAGGRDCGGPPPPSPRQPDGEVVGAHRYGADFSYP